MHCRSSRASFSGEWQREGSCLTKIFVGRTFKCDESLDQEHRLLAAEVH